MESFYQALDAYIASSETLSTQEENRLWEMYGQDRAVLCLDLSGFTFLTQKHGLFHFLSMIRRMQLTTASIVKHYGGSVVKFEADNLFAVFDSVDCALQTAIDINLTFETANQSTELTKHLYACIGISYGRILLVEGKDLFGDAVNLASKLGEDIADKSEILLTKEAADRLVRKDHVAFRPEHYSISGLRLDVLKVVYV